MRKFFRWLVKVFDTNDYCSYCGYYCNGKSVYCTKDIPNKNIDPIYPCRFCFEPLLDRKCQNKQCLGYDNKK